MLSRRVTAVLALFLTVGALVVLQPQAATASEVKDSQSMSPSVQESVSTTFFQAVNQTGCKALMAAAAGALPADITGTACAPATTPAERTAAPGVISCLTSLRAEAFNSILNLYNVYGTFYIFDACSAPVLNGACTVNLAGAGAPPVGSGLGAGIGCGAISTPIATTKYPVVGCLPFFLLGQGGVLGAETGMVYTTVQPKIVKPC